MDTTTFRALALMDMFGSGSGGGGVNLANADLYLADFLNAPPTITEGSLDTLNRRIYVV